MNELGVHHHFRLKEDNVGYQEGPRFVHLPMFKLYPNSKKSWIRESLELMAAPLPNRLQPVIRKISPNPEFFNHYRSEHFPTELLQHGNSKIFGRMYQLMDRDHLKVELTIHSDLLSGRKNYNFNSAISLANQFFNRIERDCFVDPLPLEKHLPDFYRLDEFQEVILNPIENQFKQLQTLPS